MDADHVIAILGLQPHPEGGWYAETWRADPPPPEGGLAPRPAGSAIYFLLRAGEESAWHRVDAAEIWHFYAGSALKLRIAADAMRNPGIGIATHVLGTDLEAGHRPQVIVPAGHWQSARPLGAWTLVGCTVSPAFTFDGFELAPPGWEPAGG